MDCPFGAEAAAVEVKVGEGEGRRTDQIVAGQEKTKPIGRAVAEAGEGDMGREFAALPADSSVVEEVFKAVMEESQALQRLNTEPEDLRYTPRRKKAEATQTDRQRWAADFFKACGDILSDIFVDLTDKLQGQMKLIFRDSTGRRYADSQSGDSLVYLWGQIDGDKESGHGFSPEKIASPAASIRIA